MKRFLLASFVVLATFAQANASIVLTQWNFNGASAASVPGTASSPGTSVGFGTASLVGGVTSTTFNNGVGSSDLVLTSPANFGWQTTNYPAIAAADKTAGVQFAVNTTGYQNVIVSWDQRHSNTAANTFRFQYSTNGTTFIDSTQFTFTPAATGTGDTWYNGRSVNLSSISGVNNNAQFAFRVVAEFAPTTSGYLASRSTSTYGPTGASRFDMVTVNATAVPEPTSMALLSMVVGVGAVGARFRKRVTSK